MESEHGRETRQEALGGGIVFQAESGYEHGSMSCPGGWEEQQAMDWWQALKDCARRPEFSQHGKSVTCVALTGQMQNLILLDKHGHALRNAILYNDTRASEEARFVEEEYGREALVRETGNWKGACSLLPKLLWVSKHEREVVDQTATILLGAHDFVTLKLCGEGVSDFVTASTTGLLTDDHQEFHVDLISRFLASAVPCLPKLVHGNERTGSLSPAAAEELGLVAGIPVVHGSGDAGSTTIGAGAGVLGRSYMYMGTSGWIACSKERTRRGGGAGLFHLAHPCEPKLMISAASCMQAGANLEWLRRNFFAGHSKDEAYLLMEQAGASVGPGANGLIFCPWLAGERSPFTDENARACFIGISPSTTTAHLCRAVMEGVCYSYKSLSDTLELDDERSVRAVGGGTRSRLLMQIMADVLGRDVEVVADPQQVGTRGAAMLARSAMGKTMEEECTEVADTFTCDHGRKKVYQEMYACYNQIYRQMQPVFASLASARRACANANSPG
uniref:glycerol kinase n=1 Tax=Guillardia theta TaxID=55529 RepID=A0A6U5X001_GUITH